MIIKTEIKRIRKYMTDIILSVLADNGKYISTYYKHKKHLYDPIDERLEDDDVYEDLIYFLCISGDLNYITDIYLKKNELKFIYTDHTNGCDCEDFVEILPIEALYSIIKWLQRYNFLDDILCVKYCYFCGQTDLQKLAWVNANTDNKFIEFYNEDDNNVFCDNCQRNTSCLEYDKSTVPIELVNQWFASISVDVLEDMTGLSTKNFKNDKDNLDFLSKCKQFWDILSEAAKRDFWIRFRDI